MEPTDAFAELSRMEVGDTGLQGVLVRVAALAKQTLRAATEVSVTLVRGPGAHTATFTGSLALQLDEWQYEQGHGPCLAAAQDVTTLYVAEMTDEPRWPDWSARAASAGAHSCLAIGLTVQDSAGGVVDTRIRGALNLYAVAPRAFDAATIALAERFAGYATTAVAGAHLHDATASLGPQMRAAMEGSAVIEQARGMIMRQRSCSSEAAFAVLTRASRESNRDLRDVATALVEQAQATQP
ncbi:MAG TPA: GAF and ANTAR domain-containing protein [Micromonosporaceae bacterium]|nr:GAF and ANTAR domain-containing protein [Micromonosporaceae bacterium]